jgi:hypothetical protein
VVNGKVSVTDGPDVETKEKIGGLWVLEARDLNHAIGLMSNTSPGAGRWRRDSRGAQHGLVRYMNE